MKDDELEDRRECANESIYSAYMRQFGKSAFGIISLLIIWFAIVRPELLHSRDQVNNLQSLMQEMQRMTAEQQKSFSVVVHNQNDIISNQKELIQLSKKLSNKEC